MLKKEWKEGIDGDEEKIERCDGGFMERVESGDGKLLEGAGTNTSECGDRIVEN